MILDLQPVRGEAEFGDPALTGDWAAGLPAMLAEAKVAPWCSYAVRRDAALVGLGGFKGPPDAQGQVEIAYLTFKPLEGQGIATAVAAALVRLRWARARGASWRIRCRRRMPPRARLPATASRSTARWTTRRTG